MAITFFVADWWVTSYLTSSFLTTAQSDAKETAAGMTDQ